MRVTPATARAAGEPTILGLRLEEVAAACGCAVAARAALALSGADLVLRPPVAGPTLLSTVLTWWVPVLALALCRASRLGGAQRPDRTSGARTVGLVYAVGLAIAAAHRLLAA